LEKWKINSLKERLFSAAHQVKKGIRKAKSTFIEIKFIHIK